MAEATLMELEHLEKSFGGSPVLRGVSLSVRRGEFLTLLGPSGCGKTTTLRIAAGLTVPDAGRVLLSGTDVTALPPEKREVNTVFQNYALFPHMNVEKNIAYGLKIRGASREEQRRTVQELLRLVALEGYEKRMPAQLSGGQRQRVAIARAVALQPRVLLLDEPLGALDLKLRQQMQKELKNLQQRLGISFVYVTHDQEEALNMSDRIAIMRDGLIEQLGTPEEIYERPATRFAARFIGQGSILEGRVEQAGASATSLRVPGGLVLASPSSLPSGQRAAVSVHAERIQLSMAPMPGFTLRAVVRDLRYAGSLLRAELQVENGDTLTAHAVGALSQLPPVGSTVYPYWEPASGALIPGEEGADA